MERRNAWKSYDADELECVRAFAARYRDFLGAAKTERECVRMAIAEARSRGFVDLNEKAALEPGDRVYVNQMDKALLLFVVGRKPPEAGLRILGAHIDSPRLDVKQNPLYEEDELAYLDTHYYGGIKKYQWLALPLALHGVVVRRDGTRTQISIGEHDDEPVFCISDLLPHLAGEQMKKEAANLIEGEALNLIVGGMPVPGVEKDAVKERVLAYLKETYDFEEEDFLSAELEAVPAGAPRDMGFDRSMILAYGHDDRVCAYPSLEALIELSGVPEQSCVCVLADKEEIGSVGATGMQSRFLENAVSELIARTGAYSELRLKRALANSRMLSSDVSAAYDPNFPAQFEKKNSAYLGRGVCFNKYTGARGKSGSSDANAEYIGWLRGVLDGAGVAFQTAEIGRVDAGGGGTIAYLCAKYCMNVIDCGVAVLSMHAPFEIISKADLYEAYRCYVAFLRAENA